MNSLASTNRTNRTNGTNNGNSHGIRRLNAGNLQFDAARTPVMGGVLAQTVFGDELGWDIRRPQILVTCESPAFMGVVQQLHCSNALVGVSRAQLPNGGYLAAIVYKNDEQSLAVWFNPHSQAGKALLRDWHKHQNMHITFVCGKSEFSNRQELTNSLIPKLLAAQSPKGSGRKDTKRQFVQRLGWMHQIAQANETDKKRLFVMLTEVPGGVIQGALTRH